MGLLNFIKDAEKSFFGVAEAAEPDADVLKAEIDKLGLDASGLDISVDCDTVSVDGNAVSQEMKEKIILAVGNVEGVAGVEDNAGGGGTFHTVVRGNTLSAIAKKTLGSANRYPENFEANKPMLTHPDKIYPDQVLRIPN